MRGKDRFSFRGVQCEIAGEMHPVADLSLGGFFVAARHPIRAGAVLAVRLQVGERSIPLHVKVMWVNEGPSPKHPAMPAGFGVSIRRIDLRDKLALIEVLRRAAHDAGAGSRRAQPSSRH